MLEVLVAMIILALGALGIAALQARALKGNESSLQRSQAVISANYMLEAMRANTALMVNSGMVCAGGNGTFNTWVGELSTTLGPGSCGQTTCAANGVNSMLCTVTVQWNDTRAGGNAQQQVALSTLLSTLP